MSNVSEEVVEVEGVVEDQLRLIGRIAIGVAHDLNNYLGATGALLALLARTPADARLLARTRASLDQAQRLTRTLVGYVCHEASRFEPVDLGAIVDRTLSLVAYLIPPAIDVRTEIAAQLPPVRGVATELEQLVLNLVLNAADAMPDGGVLRVRVQPTGGATLYLEVTDTGPGMPAGALDTGGGWTASSKPGRRAGLGLGIVRWVVDHHGGTIRFAARIDRPGTIAWVVLPVD